MRSQLSYSFNIWETGLIAMLELTTHFVQNLNKQLLYPKPKQRVGGTRKCHHRLLSKVPNLTQHTFSYFLPLHYWVSHCSCLKLKLKKYISIKQKSEKQHEYQTKCDRLYFKTTFSHSIFVVCNYVWDFKFKQKLYTIISDILLIYWTPILYSFTLGRCSTQCENRFTKTVFEFLFI